MYEMLEGSGPWTSCRYNVESSPISLPSDEKLTVGVSGVDGSAPTMECSVSFTTEPYSETTITLLAFDSDPTPFDESSSGCDSVNIYQSWEVAGEGEYGTESAGRGLRGAEAAAASQGRSMHMRDRESVAHVTCHSYSYPASFRYEVTRGVVCAQG